MCRVSFLPAGVTEVAVAGAFPLDGIRGTICGRVARMGRWMSEVRLARPLLTGAFDLWVGDVPIASCLAFSSGGTGHGLIPDCDFMESQGYAGLRSSPPPPWVGRNDTVFWRGALTGNSDRCPYADWREIPRLRLCLHAQELGRPDLFDFGLTGPLTQLRNAAWAAQVKASGVMAANVPLETFGDHRATVDIDGNSSSWAGLFRKLLLGCTVLKVDSERGFRQWWYGGLRPWVNFVPVSSDLSDLQDAAEWVAANPRRAEAIASAGRALADSITYAGAVDETAAKVQAWIEADPPSRLAG